MSLVDKVVLISGANRGIGAATVRRLLNAGVKKIYAGARNVASLPDFGDARVVPLQLDVTDETSIKHAASTAADVDVLVNNAGTMAFNDFISSSRKELDGDMKTNYYGTLSVIRAFVPEFQKRGSGTIVNIVSILGLAPVPVLGGYSASKAALQSLTQTLRANLAKSGISVIGVYPGPIDTELSQHLPIQKATPEHAADNIVKGIENGDAYIFPDPTAQQIEYLWANEGRKLEAAMQSGG